ncbi:MAG: glycosyltransferase [Opitutales bacterium]
MLEKLLIFSAHQGEFSPHRGGPVGFIGQNFFEPVSDEVMYSWAENKENPDTSIIARIHRKLTKKREQFPSAKAQAAHTHYKMINAASYRAVYFLNFMELASCIDLIPDNQTVVFHPLNPENYLQQLKNAGARGEVIRWVEARIERAYGRVNAFVFASEGCKEIYREYLPDTHHSFFLPSGCRTQVHPHPVPLDPGKVYGLFLGRRLAVKGYDLLVDMLPILEEACPDMHIIIGGPGECLPPGPNYTDLGVIEDPSQWMSSVDFLISVNRSSYFDFAILESLRCGTPLIMTQTEGHAFFAEDAFPTTAITGLEPSAAVRDVQSSIYNAKLSCEDRVRIQDMAERVFGPNAFRSNFLKLSKEILVL